MRTRFRLLAVTLAMALSATLTPSAVADTPPPEQLMVQCPDATMLASLVGETVTGGTLARDYCSYRGPSGTFDFGFLSPEDPREDLSAERQFWTGQGTTVVDFPELGSGGFGYENLGVWVLRWVDDEPAEHLYYLAVPSTHRNMAVGLAEQFVAAIGEPPAPSVPAKDFMLTCPGASQVAAALGREATVSRNGRPGCAFKYGDDVISFAIVEGYGSILEYRSRVERDLAVAGAPPVPIVDFAGLTPGAFAWADLSPVTLSWQLEEGVVAQVRARQDLDVMRRLAVLFVDVQQDDVPTPSPTNPARPGLPSTGA